MGGSRCTYRNCTVRSDGVVHLFHYPVYDKIRCHQWLVNGQRLDFLNLKLSQLRNRVVCQHHFKDECFMNYKKEKLTHDAIPTEDGPHCETQKETSQPIEVIPKDYSMALCDLEEIDKYAKKDLKSNTSVIYADFLTNGDVWEKKSLNETIWNNKVIASKKEPRNKSKIKNSWSKIDEYENICEQSMITLSDLTDTTNTKISEFENPLLANINLNQNNENVMHSNLNISKVKSFKKLKKDENDKKDNVQQEFSMFLANKEPTNVAENRKCVIEVPDTHKSNIIGNQENIVHFDGAVGSNNINIETISEILPADQDIQKLLNIQNKNHVPTTNVELPIQLISANTNSNDYCAIIQNPNELSIEIDLNNTVKPKEEINNFITIDQWKAKKPKITILSEKTISDPVLFKGQLQPVSPSTFITLPKKSLTSKPVTEFEIKCEEIRTNENTPQKPDVLETENNIRSIVKKRVNKANDVVPKTVLKHKIAPERVAAIEKKRNFNKKLRDIIEICLDKLDDQDKTNEEVKLVDTPILRDPKQKTSRSSSVDQNIGTYLSNHAELPDTQEYMIKFLEARMKKMENVLLGKIEQNSQKIIELKNTIVKSPQVNKTAGTQTSQNQECYKKQLYQEISKFLSPNANSLVYEELFINKYEQKILKPSPKRRKRR